VSFKIKQKDNPLFIPKVGSASKKPKKGVKTIFDSGLFQKPRFCEKSVLFFGGKLKFVKNIKILCW
jgi:hypothetical protein